MPYCHITVSGQHLVIVINTTMYLSFGILLLYRILAVVFLFQEGCVPSRWRVL